MPAKNPSELDLSGLLLEASSLGPIRIEQNRTAAWGDWAEPAGKAEPMQTLHVLYSTCPLCPQAMLIQLILSFVLNRIWKDVRRFP